MSASIKITPKIVQLMQLASLDLLHPPQEPASKQHLIEHIRRMGYLQIDTMQAVARSPYLALWSRFGDYREHWLDDLLKEKQLFEFWAHALCFIPIEDFYLYRSLNIAGKRPSQEWPAGVLERYPGVDEEVMTIIHTEGPQSSADFDSTRHHNQRFFSGWGDRKPEKLVMDALFNRMHLMISHRTKFRRYYDLRERILPGWDDGMTVPPEEAIQRLILKAIKALGIASPAWARDYFYFRVNDFTDKAFTPLAGQGQLIPVEVEEWSGPYYLHPDNLPMLQSLLRGEHEADFTTFLSPFDPLLTYRKRLRHVFNFDYQLESYTPADKRVYGYFSLPILHKGQLIGRLDPKAWRSEKRMEIKSIHLEPGVRLTGTDHARLRERLWDFTRWHGLKEWVVQTSDPPELAGQVSA